MHVELLSAEFIFYIYGIFMKVTYLRITHIHALHNFVSYFNFNYITLSLKVTH
jgi:hypothetical protein